MSGTAKNLIYSRPCIKHKTKKEILHSSLARRHAMICLKMQRKLTSCKFAVKCILPELSKNWGGSYFCQIEIQ